MLAWMWRIERLMFAWMHSRYRLCTVNAFLRHVECRGGDFEDNLQIATAITDFMQAIVTRDPMDFAASPIRVYSPQEFIDVVQR
jgi:hypothetical protein